MEQIEAFLDGAISKAELQQQANALGETDLDEKIEWFQNTQTAIEAVGLRNQLQDILPKPQHRKARVVNLSSKRWVWAAAASVLLLVVGYWGVTQFSSPGLYAEYEYVDPGLPVLMSQSDDYQLYDALTYYGEGNYAVAEEKLLQIEAQYPNSDTLAYYLGASQLYQGKTAEAKQPLQKVATANDSRFTQRAEWLLVLAALKEKDTARAKELLQAILNTNDHEFLQKALDLQKELEK